MKPANRRTDQFNQLYFDLPSHVRRRAVAAFQRFLRDPFHPSLRRHVLKATRLDRHVDDSVSISIGMQYRAIFVHDDELDLNHWYWIGSHADYDAFTGV